MGESEVLLELWRAMILIKAVTSERSDLLHLSAVLSTAAPPFVPHYPHHSSGDCRGLDAPVMRQSDATQ